MPSGSPAVQRCLDPSCVFENVNWFPTFRDQEIWLRNLGVLASLPKSADLPCRPRTWPSGGQQPELWSPLLSLLFTGPLCSLSSLSGPQKLSSLPPWKCYQKPAVTIGPGQRSAFAEMVLSTLMPIQLPEGTPLPSAEVLLTRKPCVQPRRPSILNDLAGKCLGLLEACTFSNS